MDQFTIELICIASAQLFQDDTLGSFTNFIPEHLNLEGHQEIANSETFYLLRYQNVTGKIDVFSIKKIPK